MKLDLEASIQISKIILGMILNELGFLLVHLVIGLLIGLVIAYSTRRLIKAKGWFKRDTKSHSKRIFLYLLQSTFFLSIIGVSCTVALVIGSNKIVEKQVNLIVDESVEYIKANYFNDYAFVEEIFQASDFLYAKGYDLNQANHKIAEMAADEVAKKYGLGFLGSFLLKSPKKDMVNQVEDLERGFIIILVSKGLEHIGAGDIVKADQIDKAFYAWLQNDRSASLGSINSVISNQTSKLVKPIIFGIWSPFLVVCVLVILANLVEIAVFYYRKWQREKDAEATLQT